MNLVLDEGLSFAATAAIVVDAVVAADGIEPRSEICIGVELVQRAEDPKKYFLGQILRLLVASREFIRDPEDTAPETPDDFLPGLLFDTSAAAAELYDLPILELAERNRLAVIWQSEILLMLYGLFLWELRPPRSNPCRVPETSGIERGAFEKLLQQRLGPKKHSLVIETVVALYAQS